MLRSSIEESVKDKRKSWSSPNWALDTAVTRLRIGHTRHNAYLHRLGMTDSSHCPWFLTQPDTPEHLLLQCPHHTHTHTHTRDAVKEGRSTIWKSVAVPHCLYAIEITNYNAEDIRKLETVQNSIGRWCLGALNSTATKGYTWGYGMELLQGKDTSVARRLELTF
ncbi:hypothetical protein E2C01_083170 [Portunus trituberculatus]|uniref:Reverse transcriptase zinc-binding domain-containing protein n=1 Tax=Portunus trituberculatus TaxID=210409 RepID=A0A5B7IUE7_PORTR|nr:hypothetical protein [Portunus trituberculatus]